MKKTWKQFFVLAFMIASLAVFTSGNSASAAEAMITPPAMVTGAENVANYKAYSYAVPANAVKNVIPVKISAPGSLYIRVNESMLVDDVEIGFYKDAACAFQASSDYYFTADPNEAKTDYVNFGSAGTYYMAISYASSWRTDTAGSVNITPYFVSRANRNLTLDAWSAIAPSANEYNTYAKIVFSKAGYIGVTQRNASNSKMYMSLCKGTTAASIVDNSIEPNVTRWYPVNKGTYYIKTEGIYGATSAVKYSFKTCFSASAGQQFSVAPFNTGVYDIKIKANKTGLLTLSLYNNESAYFTFLNSKKKPISDSLWTWGGSQSIAVKKNAVYYIRCNASIGDDTRVMSYSIQKASTRKNTKMKKAMNVKKNKYAKCLILPGDTKWHYFKIKQPKTKKLNMQFKAYGTGRFTYKLIRGSESAWLNRDEKEEKITSYRAVKKGTWYFCIKMDNKKSSGYFQFKYK